MAGPAASSRGALTLEFLFGRGYVTSADVALSSWARLEAMRLELPAMRGPVDLSGGLERFRRTRPVLHEATLRLDVDALGEVVALATDEAIPGFDAPAVSWSGDSGELVVRRGEVVLGASMSLAHAPSGGLRLELHDSIASGHVAAPAALLVAEFIARLLGSPALRPLVDAHAARADVRHVDFDVAALAAGATLIPRGWKLPARHALAPLGCRGGAGVVTLHIARETQPKLPPARLLPGALRTADLDALEGDLNKAIASLRTAATRHDAMPATRYALADLLLATHAPDAASEARELTSGHDLLHASAIARSTSRSDALTMEASLTGLAQAARDCGRPLYADALLAGPVDNARSTPGPSVGTTDEDARVWIERGTTAYYDDEDVEAARHALEHARDLSPETFAEDYAALSALEDLYREDNDASGLLSVLEAKLSQTSEPEIRNVFRLTMAGVMLDELDRGRDASRLCEDVLESDPRSIPAHRLLARSLLTLGQATRAAGLLDRVLEMPELDEIEAIDVIREAARSHSVAPTGVDRALACYAALLERVPGDTEALSRTRELLAEAERWSDYASVLDRELALVTGGADPTSLPEALRMVAARVLLERSQVERVQLGAPAVAVDTLRLAAELSHEDPEIREALAFAARDAGDDASLAEALDALAPLLLDPNAQNAARAEAQAARARLCPSTEAQAPELPAAVESDDPEIMLQQLEQRLRATRAPADRQLLLLEKGRMLLGALDQAQAALLPLKGALILNAQSVDTRLALLEAYAALGDAGQASDQVRELAELLGSQAPTDAALSRVGAALAAWLNSAAAPRSDAWLAQFEALAPAWAARFEHSGPAVRT